MQNDPRKILKLILGVFLLCFVSLSIAHPTQAVKEIKLKKGQIKLIADFKLSHGGNAGGTITEKYYVFPDTKGSHGGNGTLLKAYSRSSCQFIGKTTLHTSYLSGVYNQWGTNKITLIAKGKQVGCYKVKSSGISSASSCRTPVGRSLSYQGTGQGNTAEMNDHTFKVAGYHGGIIGIWNGSGTHVATITIPSSLVKSAEPENISVDGATGEIYVNYVRSGRSLWYKINSSVSSKYTGKKGSSNPTICKNDKATSSDSSEEKDTTIHTDYVRDETASKDPPTQSQYDGVIETTYFGAFQDDGEGCGVYTTLSFIINLLTIGIGIAAIIGIVISGITYLTAKENVAQTTKAKRRIYEIIIGLVVYAVLWSLLTFLTPEFNPELKSCGAQLSESELQEREAKRQAEQGQEFRNIETVKAPEEGINPNESTK